MHAPGVTTLAPGIRRLAARWRRPEAPVSTSSDLRQALRHLTALYKFLAPDASDPNGNEQLSI
jgi:hypothetical protein